MTEQDPYMIRALVLDFENISAKGVAVSEAARERHKHRLDVAYGESAREVLDIFWPENPATNAPIHIFIHGGYWRAGSKSDCSFVANTVLDAGAIAVLVEYDLIPDQRMTTLVEQVRRAARWVRDNAEELGGDAEAISASGHSAGGHLASYLMAKGVHEDVFPDTGVRRLLLLSGIYDLGPIPNSFLQPEISLTADEVAKWSPVGATLPTDIQAVAAVGEKESFPFHDDAKALAANISAAGFATSAVSLAGEDHMTIVQSLGQAGTDCAALLLECIAGAAAK